MQDPRLQVQLKKGKREKLNIVMDLDETMINSHLLRGFDDKSSINLPPEHLIEFSSGGFTFVIVMRPYLKEFLKQISQNYNIYCYSHGQYQYVKVILDLIDPEKQYINRDIIFKNELPGQVKQDTTKGLANLQFSEEELRKTLIMDDIRPIWDTDQGKVIPSKKYAPLKEYMEKQKLKNYTLAKTDYSSKEGPPYVTFGEAESEHFIDQQLTLQNNSSQLQVLTEVLTEMADTYNLRLL